MTYERVKIIRKPKKALSESELARLESLDRTKLTEAEKLTLDKFLFSVYTGLRVSDNNAMRKSDLSQTEEGLVLSVTTIKTNTRVTLPLRDLFGGKPEQIAKQYMKRKGADTLFPYIGREAITNSLESLHKLADVSFHMTFHTSRHTCATLLAAKCGDPYIIKDVLGHSDISIGMRYIHSCADTLRRQLSAVKW